MWLFNLQHTSVLKAQPPLSNDNVFPIYTFTCMYVTSLCYWVQVLVKVFRIFLISGFWDWLSIESQSQSTEKGRLFYVASLIYLQFIPRHKIIYYTPRKLCRGYTVFTLSVRASVRPSVTLCFLNNSKSHCWIFIKPCKHVHICKTNTLDRKIKARGKFY